MEQTLQTHFHYSFKQPHFTIKISQHKIKHLRTKQLRKWKRAKRVTGGICNHEVRRTKFKSPPLKKNSTSRNCLGGGRGASNDQSLYNHLICLQMWVPCNLDPCTHEPTSSHHRPRHPCCPAHILHQKGPVWVERVSSTQIIWVTTRARLSRAQLSDQLVFQNTIAG